MQFVSDVSFMFFRKRSLLDKGPCIEMHYLKPTMKSVYVIIQNISSGYLNRTGHFYVPLSNYMLAVGIWTTRTHDNSYPRQLIPRTTRTQDESYLGKLVLRKLVI